MTIAKVNDSITYQSASSATYGDTARPADVVVTYNAGSLDANGNVLAAAAPGADTGNSSSATLGGGAVYTGTWTQVDLYTTINVSVRTDQASATDGLSIQQSSDGTNADILDTFTVASQAAGGGKTYRAQVAAKYYRVVYTNGATPNTVFRLQTVLKTADAANSVRPADAYSNENDMGQTQAFDMVWNGTNWDRRKGDTNGGYSQGNVASGAADAGNPVKMGLVYNTSFPTVTNGQRVDWQSGNRGVPFVELGSNALNSALASGAPADSLSNSGQIGVNVRSNTLVYNGSTWDRARGNTTGTIVIPPQGWSYAAATSGIVNTTTAVTIKAAAGASVRNYLSSLQIDTDTLGGATEIAIRDGAAGTVIWRGKLQTTAGNRSVVFDTPIYSTANTLLEVVTLTAVTGGVYVSAQGFTAP